MHIFIDETGPFKISTHLSPGMVGALIIPDANLSRVEKQYAKIRKRLKPNKRGEVKGKDLNEEDVAKVAKMLFRNEYLFEFIFTDMVDYEEGDLKEHQKVAANELIYNLKDSHPDRIRKPLLNARDKLASMKLPEYVQATLGFLLIKQLLEIAPMYYSQRRPTELCKFNWVIDAKGDNGQPTDWEQWWSAVLTPIVQSMSIRNPTTQLRQGDYSHMRRFEMEGNGGWPEVNEDEYSPVEDLQMILGESRRFSSEPEFGLELVDIVTNGAHRAFVGHLQKLGWIDIPKLQVNRNTRGNFTMVAMRHKLALVQVLRPYHHVMREYPGTVGRCTPSTI